MTDHPHLPADRDPLFSPAPAALGANGGRVTSAAPPSCPTLTSVLGSLCHTHGHSHCLKGLRSRVGGTGDSCGPPSELWCPQAPHQVWLLVLEFQYLRAFWCDVFNKDVCVSTGVFQPVLHPKQCDVSQHPGAEGPANSFWSSSSRMI